MSLAGQKYWLKSYHVFNIYYWFCFVNRCVPACDGCEHGQCIAPRVCDCYSGYELINGGKILYMSLNESCEIIC